MMKRELPADTVMVKGLPWTPKMIMRYRSVSMTYASRLLQSNTWEDILMKPHLSANVHTLRPFVDKSAIITYGGREWSLAMVYTYLCKQLYAHERPLYTNWRARVFDHIRRDNATSLKNAVDIVAERMGLGLISIKLPTVSEAQYERIKEEYKFFISANKTRKHFYENEHVNNDWYEVALDDPDIQWFVAKLAVEQRHEYKDKYDELQQKYLTLLREHKQLQSEVATLAGKVMQLTEELENGD